VPSLTEVAPEQLEFDANLFQCALWARFKQGRRTPTQAFHIHHRGRRYPLVVVHRPVRAEITVGYAPHGPDVPVPVDEQGPFLEALSEELRPRVPESCRVLRYDLPWSDPYLGSGEWDARPEPRVREMRMNFGCRWWNLRKAPTDLQPPDTVILDLAAPLEAILASMHPKHRYCVRTSLRRGVEVRAGSIDDLPRWHDLYRETARRAGFVAEDPEYFEALLETAAHHDPDVRLLLAERDGELLSGSIVATVADTGCYLFSASSRGGRRRFASFAVLWRAIEGAKASGCRWFDLMGVPPDDRPDHPMHTLYRFKTRFGGYLHHRRGCWDYPLDEELYPAVAMAADPAGAFHPG